MSPLHWPTFLLWGELCAGKHSNTASVGSCGGGYFLVKLQLKSRTFISVGAPIHRGGSTQPAGGPVKAHVTFRDSHLLGTIKWRECSSNSTPCVATDGPLPGERSDRQPGMQRVQRSCSPKTARWNQSTWVKSSLSSTQAVCKCYLRLKG